MSRITKLLSLVVLFSFVLATENTEETIVEKTALVEEIAGRGDSQTVYY